jgi:hypothetical protein
MQDRVQNHRGGGAGERTMSRRRLVEHPPEGEEVRPCVELAPLDLVDVLIRPVGHRHVHPDVPQAIDWVPTWPISPQAPGLMSA